MPTKLTITEFIKRAKSLHGDKYNYDKIKHLFEKDKITIICNKHNKEFEQNVYKHLKGHGCPDCGIETRTVNNTMSKQDFILKASEIHKYKYNYDKVIYITGKDKVIITCPTHGDFLMSPANHKHKTKPQGCRDCSGKTKWTLDKFIAKSIEIHKDENGNQLYDYSKVKFTTINDHVEIICNKHESFSQRPAKHLKGQKCKYCSIEIVAKKNSRTRDEFIFQAKSKHGDFYDYSEVPNELTKENVWIICPHHGRFPQKVSVHVAGSGCPNCNFSKGEQKIQKILNDLNIQFETQAKFSDCKYKRELPFDFLINYNNCKYLIEFNGPQHYSSEKFWGSNKPEAIKKFEELKQRDQIKIEYAKANNIPLLILKENDNLIAEIKGFLKY